MDSPVEYGGSLRLVQRVVVMVVVKVRVTVVGRGEIVMVVVELSVVV